MDIKKNFLPWGLIILCLLISGIGMYYIGKPNQEPYGIDESLPAYRKGTVKVTTQLANPASTNCQEKGGLLEIKTLPDGNQYGLCFFDDNRACEEWAMMRGDCPVGGVKTTGYDTDSQKYCAWLGGKTVAEKDADCTFADKSVCNDDDLYAGKCFKGNDSATLEETEETMPTELKATVAE